MIGNHENLDDEQQRILDALLTYPSRELAAKSLGISIATLYRRLRDAELRDAERNARQQALGEATASLQRLANDAAHMLAVIMNTDGAPFSARVAAASKLLDLAYRTYELESIVDEVEKLKQELL
jgi:hypothetical protein